MISNARYGSEQVVDNLCSVGGLFARADLCTRYRGMTHRFIHTRNADSHFMKLLFSQIHSRYSDDFSCTYCC